ncbi:glycosyltransferase family 4 protein [Spirochaeta isovalerica]|uniref:Glycosyltransferase involved in cell wall biosynthesis n=1 Tax=Spirochaeta isovalerica TaxID=150 RepID=A0A841R2K0_9SPIO|nr:glycosyltransferase family 4 protein [Spirochaeta isovalerica]MBB6479254.1 glycosyltransferase involved in cell wall biosynthesis [Spirochaeta isovalerica]
MNITFVCPAQVKSGGTRVIAIYAKKLIEKGHSVTVVSPIINKPKIKNQIKSLIKERKWIKYVPKYDSYFDFMNIPVKYLKKQGPVQADDIPDGDILVGAFWIIANWISKFPPEKGIKVHFIQGYEVTPGMNTIHIDDAWKLPMKKIVVSNWLANISYQLFNDDTYSIVQNSVNFEFFTAPKRTKQSVPTIGFTYSDHWCKAPEIAINACKLASTKYPNLKVCLVGFKPPSQSNLIPDDWQCFWDPSQDELPLIYSQCDAWLWTSRQEGFGLPIIEAMACRTPVIGTRAGAAPELLNENRGIIIDIDDIENIANAITEIIELSNKKWELMSQSCYDYVREYSWDKAVNKLESVFQELIDCSI